MSTRESVEALLGALGYRYDPGSSHHEGPAWRHSRGGAVILAEWIDRPGLIADELDLPRFIYAQGHQEGRREAQKEMRAALGLAYGFPRD